MEVSYGDKGRQTNKGASLQLLAIFGEASFIFYYYPIHVC